MGTELSRGGLDRMIFTPAERVANGIRFLNRLRKSKRWQKRIDLKTFNINAQCDCTLGQLFGTYAEGCLKLQLKEHSEEAKQLGFMPIEAEMGEYDADAKALNREWRKQLAK